MPNLTTTTLRGAPVENIAITCAFRAHYFDPIGSYGDEADVLDKGNRIRVLLNLMWRQKFRSKVDKIDNPFNKRSLHLKCFKGEGNYHPYFWEFSKFWKIPSNSLKLSYHLVLIVPFN